MPLIFNNMVHWTTLNIPTESKEKVEELGEIMEVPLGEVGQTAIDQLYRDIVGDPHETRVTDKQFEEEEKEEGIHPKVGNKETSSKFQL